MSLSTLKVASGELADCPICFLAMAEPKCLPRCGHSVCAECAKALEQSPGSSRQGVRVKCPICRRVSNVPASGLPTNFALRDLVEKINQLEMQAGEETKKKQQKTDKRAGPKKPAQSSTGKGQAGSQSRRQQATSKANTQSQMQGTSRQSSSTSSSSSSSDSSSSNQFGGGVDCRYWPWIAPPVLSQPALYMAPPPRMGPSGVNFGDLNSLLNELQMDLARPQEPLTNLYFHQSSISYGKKQKKGKDKCLIS